MTISDVIEKFHCKNEMNYINAFLTREFNAVEFDLTDDKKKEILLAELAFAFPVITLQLNEEERKIVKRCITSRYDTK